jgi:hypothetical protein
LVLARIILLRRGDQWQRLLHLDRAADAAAWHFPRWLAGGLGALGLLGWRRKRKAATA